MLARTLLRCQRFEDLVVRTALTPRAGGLAYFPAHSIVAGAQVAREDRS